MQKQTNKKWHKTRHFILHFIPEQACYIRLMSPFDQSLPGLRLVAITTPTLPTL